MGKASILENLLGLEKKHYGAGALGMGMYGTEEDAEAAFIGPLAKTWNKKAAEYFMKNESKLDRGEIWRDTIDQFGPNAGTFRGVDGLLRQELPETNPLLRNTGDLLEMRNNALGDIKDKQNLIKTNNANLKSQPDLFPGDLRKAHGGIRREIDGLKEGINGRYGLSDGINDNPTKISNRYPQDDLWGAYPAMSRVMNIQDADHGPWGSIAQYNHANQRVTMFPDAYKQGPGSSVGTPEQTVAHEIQHGIQSEEGFAKGTSPRQITGQLIDKTKDRIADLERAVESNWAHPDTEFELEDLNEFLMDLEDGGYNSQILYERAAGETEARNVEHRLNFTPQQRREQPPWASQDRMDEDQIILNTSDKAAQNPYRKYQAKYAAGTVGALSATGAVSAGQEEQGNMLSRLSDLDPDEHSAIDRLVPMEGNYMSKLAMYDMDKNTEEKRLRKQRETREEFPLFDDGASGMLDKFLVGMGRSVATTDESLNQLYHQANPWSDGDDQAITDDINANTRLYDEGTEGLGIEDIGELTGAIAQFAVPGSLAVKGSNILQGINQTYKGRTALMGAGGALDAWVTTAATGDPDDYWQEKRDGAQFGAILGATFQGALIEPLGAAWKKGKKIYNGRSEEEHITGILNLAFDN